ncbi:hypothetical protein FHS43_005700 [Streptosporangium becharense]|uniref:Uncharacterized protein n=1 Tax=Streptosporangium becharense TaxID=1816182 RepID=A0A7W9INF1_9ACTN|nr:hypothetical protein [Streptosporangium becharense]MBB2914388.1 hypothetical protein [Streptosporangium becharense]MBB5823580.1 hypothetical protein [Streptosporangium becharense]
MTDDQVAAAVRVLINRYDPEGLLGMGAPEDEYDSEVGDLTALVRGEEEITADAVCAVWNRWFDDVSDWCTRRPEQVGEVAAALEGLRGRRRRLRGSQEPGYR